MKRPPDYSPTSPSQNLKGCVAPAEKLSDEQLQQLAQEHGVVNSPITAYGTDKGYGIAATCDGYAVALAHVCELASSVPALLLTVEDRTEQLRQYREAVNAMAAFPAFRDIVLTIASIEGESAPFAALLAKDCESPTGISMSTDQAISSRSAFELVRFHMGEGLGVVVTALDFDSKENVLARSLPFLRSVAFKALFCQALDYIVENQNSITPVRVHPGTRIAYMHDEWMLHIMKQENEELFCGLTSQEANQALADFCSPTLSENDMESYHALTKMQRSLTDSELEEFEDWQETVHTNWHFRQKNYVGDLNHFALVRAKMSREQQLAFAQSLIERLPADRFQSLYRDVFAALNTDVATQARTAILILGLGK